ncbi:MAG: hypothetical protein ABSF44_02405 [Candidatus Bathyarchaeia archaeon]
MQCFKMVAEENEKKTLELLENSKMPVSIGFVAFNLKITWQTARGLLLKMSLNDKIRALQTSKGYLFELKSAN